MELFKNISCHLLILDMYCVYITWLGEQSRLVILQERNTRSLGRRVHALLDKIPQHPLYRGEKGMNVGRNETIFMLL